VPGVEPVKVELTDFKTKEHVDTLEVDAVLVATGRAPYTQVRAVRASLRLCGGHDLGPNEPCMERTCALSLRGLKSRALQPKQSPLLPVDGVHHPGGCGCASGQHACDSSATADTCCAC
jgi:hypothetical protein